jgi:hypothetical protein
MSRIPALPEPIDPVKDRAALAIGLGFNAVQAGVFAGRSDRQVRRWKKDDAGFLALVEHYASTGQHQLQIDLQALRTKAIHRLGELIDSTNENVANTAIRTALDNDTKLREEASVERRIAALETTVATAWFDEEPS